MAEDLRPSIRFAGFTDAWEQRRLGDEFVFLRNNTLSRAELSDEAGDIRNVHYGDLLIKFGALIDPRTTDLPRVSDASEQAGLTCDRLQDGDVIVADTAEDSAAGKCSELRGVGAKEVVPGLHTMPLRPVREYAEGFLAYYLNSHAFHDQLLPLMQGVKVISISRQAMSNTTITVPSLPEQRRIGTLFSSLDSLITLHQRKLDALKNVKRSLLDKMFPREGQSVPELRFAGFTDAWEQRRLGELFAESDERASDLEILSVSVANGIYPASESDRETNPGASLANYKVVRVGDVVYNSMRMWQGAVDASLYHGIVSPAYVVARPKEGVQPRFFARLLRRPEMLLQYQSASQGNSKDTQVLKFEEFANIQVAVPVSLAEQAHVAGAFDVLDSLITLHQRKLDALRNVKRSLLDKMFV